MVEPTNVKTSGGTLALVLAFASLGFLIGSLVGMTKDSVVSTLIPLLFTFGGGSAIAFMQKLTAQAQKKASFAILFLSLFCLLGVFSGIYISEQQLFTQEKDKHVATTRDDRFYLRNSTISIVNNIDAHYMKGTYSAEQAYDSLRKAMLKLTKDDNKTQEP